MNITLKQIQDDIESGKSTHIFYSTAGCWWTHLESDLEDATKTGRQQTKENHERMMADPKVPQEEKDRMKGLYEYAGKGSHPVGPDGAPLMQMDDPNKWMQDALSKPDHYGKHQLDALLLSHHQNCDNQNFDSWKGYNAVLDQRKTSDGV